MSIVSQTIINEYRDEQVHFLQLHLGGDRNFCYVLGELRSGQAAVVDPGFKANQLADIVAERRLEIRYILITHAHSDHNGTSAYFVQTLNIARPRMAADLDGMALYSWSISIPGLLGAFVTLIYGVYGSRIEEGFLDQRTHNTDCIFAHQHSFA